jgi:acetyltransferase
MPLTWVKRGWQAKSTIGSSAMAEYPAHLAVRRRLADGRCVVIRPIRPDDEAREREFLGQLSGETRRRRFMKHAGTANGGLAHFFSDIDYERHMAFICESGNTLVGDARYVGNPDRRSCEFGIVVADDWHHTGIAQLLMDALIRAARARGFETMEGIVLEDNRDMLDFVRELGFERVPAAEQPSIVRIVKKL